MKVQFENLSKPIRTLQRSQFIQLIQGEQEKFIELKIYLKKEDSQYIIDSNGIPEQVDQIADNLIQLYWKDQHDLISKKWNEERKKLILELLNNILYPNIIKKLKLKLIDEAEDGIIAQCREKFKGNSQKLQLYGVYQRIRHFACVRAYLIFRYHQTRSNNQFECNGCRQ